MARQAAFALAAAVLAWGAWLEAGTPERLAHPRYVALGFDLGNGFVGDGSVSPDVLPEEREALRRIRAAIEAWGQYVLVEPARAEMLIAIRKGRHGSVAGGIGRGGLAPGAPGQLPLTQGELGGAQFSSTDDSLEAFDASSGHLIWRATRPNGLAGATPPLFEALRAEVAKAAPQP
jgi:hypothetical protein